VLDKRRNIDYNTIAIIFIKEDSAVSAKRQKRERAEIRAIQEEAGVKSDKKKLRVNNNKFGKIIGRIIAAAVVVVIVATLVLSSPLFYSKVPALSIGGYDYTAAEYNYFFNNYYSQYAYFIDSSKPLSKQDSIFGTGTWEELFREQVEYVLQQISMLYDAGKKEGFVAPTLEPDDPDYITPAADQIASMKASASQAGYEFDDYLFALYGKGLSEELLTGLLEKSNYANAYQKELTNRKTAELTEEVLDEKYSEMAQDNDLQTYYIFTVTAEVNPITGVPSDEDLAEAKAKADALNAVHNGDDFAELVYEYAPEEYKETYRLHNASLVRDTAANSGAQYDEWLKSPDRVKGDSEIFSDSSSYTVVLFEGRNANKFHRVTYVDLTVSVVADEETGEFTSSAIQDAKDLADEIVLAYYEGEQTQESFLALNELNTSDAYTDSGVNTDIALGVSAYELEDWVFDESRKEGDVTIIYVESNGLNAYHILYYVSAEEERYDRVLAKNELLTEYNTAWREEHIGDFEIEERFGFNYRIK